MSTYDPRPLEVSSAPVVVVDLDSTVCDTAHRHGAAPAGPDRNDVQAWKPYSLACTLDRPITGMVELVRLLHGPNLVFFLSARNDVAELATRVWLLRNGVPYDRLRLRADDDVVATADYKVGAIAGWQDEGWNVRLLVDDYAELCGEVTARTGVEAITPRLPAHYTTSDPI